MVTRKIVTENFATSVGKIIVNSLYTLQVCVNVNWGKILPQLGLNSSVLLD